MDIPKIDLNRIREALPKRAIVVFRKSEKGSPYFECFVRWPGLYEKGTKEEEQIVEQVFQWQRDIIGMENISEFYTEETGSHWFVYLKRKMYEFVNLTDEDVKTFTGLDTSKLKQNAGINNIS